MTPRLRLGPIVGHTDHASARVWILARPHELVPGHAVYRLRVPGVGVFPFASTEGDRSELGAAIAIADGLRPEWEYRYEVLRHGRVLADGHGTFRTMPEPGSNADISFATISCSHSTDPGAWALLADYIKKQKPRCLLMIGDQVYLDESHDVWKANLKAKREVRRASIASIYEKTWSREPVRNVLANIPTYMMWDDHDIRNGWGSWAPDSPTLAAAFPAGAPIAARYGAYFDDARDFAWHYQLASGPRPREEIAPSPGERRAMPFNLRLGRMHLTCVDNRGARDMWRSELPVLGSAQWEWLNTTVRTLSPDVDAFALVVPLPLTSMSPTGTVQTLMGGRTDDIALFKDGKAQELLDLPDTAKENAGSLIKAGIGAFVGADWGTFKIGDLSDARDNWAFSRCRPEQERLIRLALAARTANRDGRPPRAIMLLGGDLHVGALFDVTAGDLVIPSVVTSGIAQKANESFPGVVGTVLDEAFPVGAGLEAKLTKVINDFNFGVTRVEFGGGEARIENVVVQPGESTFRTTRVGTPAKLPTGMPGH